MKGYQKKGLRLLFRGDAAFAKPELYEYLEQGKIGYAIRFPANQVIQVECVIGVDIPSKELLHSCAVRIVWRD